jgi:hypothetical protein
LIQKNHRAKGWHVDVDIPFDKSFGLLHDLLVDFLHQDNPRLHLHASLGKYQEWERPLALSGFALEGSLPGPKIPLCKGVTVTSFGVQLRGIHCVKYLFDGLVETGKQYGCGVFGSMDIQLPGWSHAVGLDFWVEEMAGQLDLSARIRCDWSDAFGFKGLVVRTPIPNYYTLELITHAFQASRIFHLYLSSTQSAV